MRTDQFALPSGRRRLRLRKRWAHARSDEEGFSLVEILVAMGIFAMVALFTTGMLFSGLRGTLLGKRREVATQEANRIVEIARSLSYNDIGLVQTDPTIGSDAAIQTQPPLTGVPSYRVDTDWEPIIWATNPTGHPFNPHKSSVSRGSTDLTRYVYVSGVDSDGDLAVDLKRVFVRVQWDNTGSEGPRNEVRASTLINESGLVATQGGGGGGTPGVDDDGDGLIDEDGPDAIDNDGDGSVNEDPVEGIDEDGDGQVDEDGPPHGGPGAGGTENVDDDGDGEVDEDGPDDDRDGQVDEDGPEAIDNDGDGSTDEDGGGGTITGLTPLSSVVSTSGGSASVRSARGDLGSLINAVLPADPVLASLPNASGKTTFRAVSSVNCTAESTFLQGANNTYGKHSVSVTADDDARTQTPSNPAPQSWSGSPPDSLGGGSDVDDLILEATLASPVSCKATAADDDGVTPTDDGLAYEKGTGSGPATLTFTEDISGAGLPSSVLTALFLQPQPISQEIDHLSVGTAREVAATASSGLGQLNVLKIPGLFSDGLVRVDALTYGASVRGAEGMPSQAPSVTAPNPIALRVYDPGNAIPNCTSRASGYCLIDVNPNSPGFTGTSVEHSGTQMVGGTTLTYEINVDALPPAKSPLTGVFGANGERRWSAEYVPLAITARLRVTVPVGGTNVLLTDTAVDLTLGKVSASACAGVTCL